MALKGSRRRSTPAPAAERPTTGQRPRYPSATGRALQRALGNRAAVGRDTVDVTSGRDASADGEQASSAVDLADSLRSLGLPAPSAVRGGTIERDSALADAHGVLGAASDDTVHLGTAARGLDDHALGRVLSHEAAHVAQARVGGRAAHPVEVEAEAHELTEAQQAGRTLQPRFKAPDAPLLDTPRDQALVERARRRAALLETFIDEYYARQARRLRTARESGPLQARRQQMDDEDAFGPLRAGAERGIFRGMNRRPLRVEVTEDTVRFHVRFHVRFEGLRRREARRRLRTLEQNFRAGVRQVWNRTLNATSLRGRRFDVEPTFELVRPNARRDPDYWMISVRPSDTGPIEFDGTELGEAPNGRPTSATNALVAHGVMSVPPSHVDRPFTLAHELLHLFGLVDRYVILTDVSPTGQRTMRTEPTRETGGRPDPLGNQPGQILDEDLDLLFAQHGVYTAEESRGLDILRRLEETERLTIGQATVELHRQREIIRTGRDPRSLIRIRTDFNDRLRQSAEAL